MLAYSVHVQNYVVMEMSRFDRRVTKSVNRLFASELLRQLTVASVELVGATSTTGASRRHWVHCSGGVSDSYNREVAGSTHTRCTASNLEQVANLLCAQANSASYPQWDGKWVVATVMGWRPSVADWDDGVSASCTVGPTVR